MSDLPFLGFICLSVSALCSIPSLVQLSSRHRGTGIQTPYGYEGLYQDEGSVSADGGRKLGGGKFPRFLTLISSLAGLLLSVALVIDIALRDRHGRSLEPGLICGTWV